MSQETHGGKKYIVSLTPPAKVLTDTGTTALSQMFVEDYYIFISAFHFLISTAQMEDTLKYIDNISEATLMEKARL